MRLTWVGAFLLAAATGLAGCGSDEKKDGGADLFAPSDLAAPAANDMATVTDAAVAGDAGGDAGGTDSGVRDGGTGG